MDPRTDPAAFRLVAGCASSVAEAEFPPGVAGVDAAQRTLEASLAGLLHGHDERQVAFLSARLLPACAAAFQQRLVQDEAAWRAYHGLLRQALAANSAALLGRLERFAHVLAAWSSPEASLIQLRAIEVKLDELAQRPAPRSRLVFDNQGMHAGGSVYQAGHNQYIGSAHAAGGGSATVSNVFGAAATADPAAAQAAFSVKLLFLAANPLDTDRLRLDQEARRVDAALRQGHHSAAFHLAQQWAVRGEDLLDALLRHRPAIVHFAGHGASDGASGGASGGQLLLEDSLGRAAAIQPATLANLLAVTGQVRCAVLNACWSGALAATLVQVLPCVVGMPGQVEDGAAIAFAAGFYHALADGESVAQAVAAGDAQVQAERGNVGAPVSAQLTAAAGVDPARVRFSPQVDKPQ